jgi:Tfp pilus assembly protein PilO
MPETQPPTATSATIPAATPPDMSQATTSAPTPAEANPVQTSAPTTIEATNKNKKDPNLAPKQQMTVGLLGGLVILAVIIAVIIRPIINDIGQTKSKIEAAETQLKQLNTKKQQMVTAQTSYQALADRLLMINEAMPNYSDVPLVAGILERLASDLISQSGGALLIQRIDFAQMPNDKPETLATGPGTTNSTQPNNARMSAEVPITVTLTGDYQSIRDYIVQLRSLRHNFYVDRLTFFAPTNDSTFLDANINLKYYYFE